MRLFLSWTAACFTVLAVNNVATRRTRGPCLAILVATGVSAAWVTAGHAQTRNPYYELQCSLSGAYCDRVYEQAPRPESFDEFRARKAREQAQAQRERDARAAQQYAQDEQQRAALAERQRQAQAARELELEQQARLTAYRIDMAPGWIRWFRTGWPVPQWIVAGLLLSFATVAYIGRREFASPPGRGFFACLGLSLVCLPLTYAASADADATAAMLRAFLLSFAFLGVNALHFLRGWHHLFVSHPATGVAMPPMREGTLFPKADLARALRPDPTQLFDHPPVYQSRDLMHKAQALRDKIEADAEITAAAMRRDRARAAKMQADAELRNVRKKLPWWQRWIWW